MSFANIEIKSENIIFYGDVSPEDGERLVRNLETYRAVILTLSGGKTKPDPVPLRIYAFKNEKALTKFSTRRNVSGLYMQGTEGPIFLTVSKGGFKDNKWSSQVALHEYSHHVLHALSRDTYPRWYDEGFANYLSTFDIKGDVISIGAPKVAHGLALKEGGWMDAKKVLSAIKRYPSSRRQDKFYGQSWLYVHYLQNTPELSAKLPDYLNQLKTQSDPLRAFESAFGLTIEAFHQRARVYWLKNAFPIASFKATSDLIEHETYVRKLSDEAYDLAFAKAKLNFLDKKSALKLQVELEALAPSLGENSGVALVIAEAAMIGGDYGTAKKYLSQAIKTSKITSNLLRLRGDIAYHKLEAKQFEGVVARDAKVFQSNAELEKAIRYFEDALVLEEKNKTSNLHLLALLGRSDAVVSDEGLKAVERSYELFLTPSDIGQYISVANVMARTGKTLRACDNYRYAKGRIAEYKDKDVNDDFTRLKMFEQAYVGLCE